jgi:hypothetical protein
MEVDVFFKVEPDGCYGVVGSTDHRNTDHRNTACNLLAGVSKPRDFSGALIEPHGDRVELFLREAG